MSHPEWIITVVDRNVAWRRATARALVTEAGLSLRVAMRWDKVRRTMSPAGLKRKAQECRN